MRVRLRYAIVAVAIAGILLTGCTAEGEEESDSWLDAPYDEKSATSLTSLLTEGGVAVVSEQTVEAVMDAPSDVVISTDQVVSMAAQIIAGGGSTANELDALAPLPLDAPPLSFLLAGWARDHDGPGATAARSILRDADWKNPATIIWPDAVLSLFLADATTMDARFEDGGTGMPDAGDTTDARPSIQTASMHHLDDKSEIGALCTAVASFVDAALARVYSAIQQAAAFAQAQAEKYGGAIFGSIVGSALGQLVGYAVGLFNEVLKGVIEAITTVLAPVITVITKALVVIGIIQQVASAIRPWSLGLWSEPGPLVAGPDVVAATATLQMDPTMALDFPEAIRQCAKAVDVELPPKPGPGAPVTWTFDPRPIAFLATQLIEDTELDEKRRATLDYHLNAEPPERWGGEPFDWYWIDIRAQVDQSKALEPLKKMALSLITGVFHKLPPAVETIFGELVASLSTTAINALATAIAQSPTAPLVVPFTYHGIKDEPLKRVPPAHYTERSAFCEAFATYEVWAFENAAAVITPFALQIVLNFYATEQLQAPPVLQRAQSAVVATAPASIADLVATAMPMASGWTSLEEANAAGKAAPELMDWALTNCDAKSKATLEEVWARYRPPG